MSDEPRPMTMDELLVEVQRRMDRGDAPVPLPPDLERRVRERRAAVHAASARIAAGDAKPHPRRDR